MKLCFLFTADELRMMKLIIGLLMFQVSVVRLVTVHPHLKACLEKIVSKFNEDPSDERFQFEIQCGARGLYSVLIWSPMEVYGCIVKCKDHGIPLIPNMLTDDFSYGNRYRNPR